jgi:hypothetical protein
LQSIGNSTVIQEPAHLVAGLSVLHFSRFDVFNVNPPLVNTLAASSSYLIGIEFSDPEFEKPTLTRDELDRGNCLILENAKDFRRYLIASRMIILMFYVLGAWCCWKLAFEIYGRISAYIALFLWCFTPMILGNAAIVMNDLPSAAMGIFAVYTFYLWLKKRNEISLLVSGLVLGLAEVSKFSLLILYLIFILIIGIDFFLFQKEKNRVIFQYIFSLFLIFSLSIFVINIVYMFSGTFSPLGKYYFKSLMLTGYDSLSTVPATGDNRVKDSILAYIPMPFPSNYIIGIDRQRLDFERGLPSYLHGIHNQHGWWYYYLYALLVKIPLGTIGLFLLAIFCTFFQKGYNTSWRDEIVILLPGIVLLTFVSSQTGFSIHSRYIIPALPFFFIWMSKIGNIFSLQKTLQKNSLRTRFLQVLVLILLFWSVLSSLWVYPHSISYFNELAAILPTPNEPHSPQEPEGTCFIVSLLNSGPRNGGRHLLDSNIDWGQDLFYLEKWCLQHSEVTEISTAIYGSYPLEQTKIPANSIPPINVPQSGWYALSVNYLYDREKQYRYFLNLKPVARAGYSIYIYHVTLEDANQIRREMGLPEI